MGNLINKIYYKMTKEEKIFNSLKAVVEVFESGLLHDLYYIDAEQNRYRGSSPYINGVKIELPVIKHNHIATR